jgi:phytanoyl-CoA hydroxylase
MGTAMWIAVHDATLQNGTLQVIPDVFRTSFEHSRDPYSDHHIRCYPPKERAVHLQLPAGGVAFFCYGTPHSTGPNRTERERAGAAFHRIPSLVRRQRSHAHSLAVEELAHRLT